jgi:hypothetical protein
MNAFVGVAVFSSQVLLQVPEPWLQSYGAGASMVLASKPKHCYIGWDIVRGDETAPQGVVLDEAWPLLFSVVVSPAP